MRDSLSLGGIGFSDPNNIYIYKLYIYILYYI
jgi:hypothetical protein